VRVDNSIEERYLHLLRVCLTRSFREASFSEIPRGSRTLFKALRYGGYSIVQKLLHPFNLALVQTNRSSGETMMGMGALENLHSCMHEVLRHNVPGDFVEAGIWRGGGTIYMRAFLEAYKIQDRTVWAADSFEGLPKPKHEIDRGSKLWASEYLAVSLDEVRKNFEFYRLLDKRVRFMQGFFSDTMPTAPIEKIGVLRLDADMYESTIMALEHLYPKVSRGGFVIVDDYGMVPECNRAVEDYRTKSAIAEPLQIIGYVQGHPLGAYWRRG
jgi:O-methyltransferase